MWECPLLFELEKRPDAAGPQAPAHLDEAQLRAQSSTAQLHVQSPEQPADTPPDDMQVKLWVCHFLCVPEGRHSTIGHRACGRDCNQCAAVSSTLKNFILHGGRPAMEGIMETHSPDLIQTFSEWMSCFLAFIYLAGTILN